MRFVKHTSTLHPAHKKQPQEKKHSPLISSPMVISVVSGLFLGFFSWFFQHNHIKYQKELEFKKEITLLKKDLLSDFSFSIDRYLTLSHSNRKRAIYLNAWSPYTAKNTPIPPYCDGKTFAQSYAEYQSQIDKIFSGKHPNALCATAIALFDDTTLSRTLNDFSTHLDTFDLTYTMSRLDSSFYHCRTLSALAIGLMTEELKGDLRYEPLESR